jgi:hypothetical protein
MEAQMIQGMQAIGAMIAITFVGVVIVAIFAKRED